MKPMISRTSEWFTLALMALTFMAWATPAQAAWENGYWASIIQVDTITSHTRACSDGQGGTLVVSVDVTAPEQKIRLTRLDHNGNEIWADGGISVPRDLASEGQAGPAAMAPDGSGGAYCAYRENYGGVPYLAVAHMDASGSLITRIVLANLGTFYDGLDVALVPSADGDVVVAWNNYFWPENTLWAARLAGDLSVVWARESGIYARPLPTADPWFIQPDGQGGVFLASRTYLPAGGTETRLQHLSAAGTTTWNGDGVLLWTHLDLVGKPVGLVAGSSGDAFVICSKGYGDATAQHVDAAGNPTWTPGGLLVQDAATYPDPCTSVACTDQAGGFFVVTGAEDLTGQRIDALGNLLWGSTGVMLTSRPYRQTAPAVASDAHGGMMVVYEDHFFSGDTYNHALSGLRLDAFANTLWAREGFWWTGNLALPDAWRVAAAQVVADGSGGGHVVWSMFDDSWNNNDVYAAGFGPDGATPAQAVLTALWPDSGAPGEVLGLAALGDYLDPDDSFALEMPGSTMTLNGTVVTTGTLVGGTVNLNGPVGAYDLVCRRNGAAVAVLENAFGLGAGPDCGGDNALQLADLDIASFGSQRKAAFDSQGRAHYAALGLDPDSGDYMIKEWVGVGEGGAATPLLASRDLLRDLAFALGPNDEPHVVFVSTDGSEQVLNYLRDRDLFQVVVPDGVRNPALALDAERNAMIVFESDIMGSSALFYLQADDNGLGNMTDLVSGAGAGQPDLCLDQDGFTLAFVRDFWFPGLHEVCRQLFRDGAWQAPESLQFGLNLTSPSVAWDGDQLTLLSWILDNSGTQPLLHTQLFEGDQAGPVRWRLGDGLIYRCSVAASAPGAFRLLTQESVSGIPMAVYLRSGDGNVFYPRRRVNTRDDVDFAVLAAQRSGDGLFAAWEDHDLLHEPVSYYFCASPVSAVQLPEAHSLGLQASPNPFNPRTTISFTLAEPGKVRLTIYDLRGALVRRLAERPLAAGPHAVVWDGTDDRGRRPGSGIYLARLESAETARTIKVVMLK